MANFSNDAHLLKWEPEISFNDLVKEMVIEDMNLAEQELKLKK